MIGFKKPLGKGMIGFKMPLSDIPNIDVMTRDLAEKKKMGGLEKAKRGSGWKLGQYA